MVINKVNYGLDVSEDAIFMNMFADHDLFHENCRLYKQQQVSFLLSYNKLNGRLPVVPCWLVPIAST